MSTPSSAGSPTRMPRSRYVDALGRRAHLAGVEQRRVGQRLDRRRHRRVGAHDEGVLAAQLEVEVLHHRGGDLCDALTGLDRAGHGDHADRGVADERLAGLGAAGDHVDHARGQVGEAALDPVQRDQRRQLAGLDDDRVARGQRRRELPGEQQQWEVPGDDGPDDAVGLLEHQVELRARLAAGHDATAGVAPELGVVAQGGGGPLDLLLLLGPRLALLADEGVDQGRGQLLGPGRRLVQQRRPVVGRGPAPRVRRPGGRDDGAVHVGVAGCGDPADDLAGGGVVDVDHGVGRRRDRAARDPQCPCPSLHR
jgi:hypothetical protein